MKKPVIKVDVVSDVVCPWCYIGKRRLEKAVDALADTYDFDIRYQPFELNPDLPEEGINLKQYLTVKFGGEQRYAQITQRVTQVAKEEGLIFNFDSQPISPNTRTLHVLIQYAKEHGKQNQVKEAFMKAYFEDGVDLSSKDSIINVAENAGLLRSDITPLFENASLKNDIEKHEREMQTLGITEVPFYIINNKYGISGAQPVEEFIKAFTEIGLEQNINARETCTTEDPTC
jgi:predicted DsbA family dithiol-disulfide isomerase